MFVFTCNNCGNSVNFDEYPGPVYCTACRTVSLPPETPDTE